MHSNEDDIKHVAEQVPRIVSDLRELADHLEEKLTKPGVTRLETLQAAEEACDITLRWAMVNGPRFAMARVAEHHRIVSSN